MNKKAYKDADTLLRVKCPSRLLFMSGCVALIKYRVTRFFNNGCRVVVVENHLRGFVVVGL